MAEKTFKQAFAEARKQGLKKFQYKGGWYTTERADEKSAPTQGSVEKGNYKEKYGRSNGTVTNRYVVKNENNGYIVYDNEVGRYIGNTHKDKESVAKYMKSDKFKDDAGEYVSTAAYTKLTRKTPGFQPVDENKNYNDKQGNTRLYQERGTGRYLVTDNYGNIVGQSFDPAAATSDANWGGWMTYTGSKNDLKAAGAGKLRDEANRNEVNQKSKQARDRKLDPREQQLAGLRRLQGGFNTAQSIMNLPNHAIVGGLHMIGSNILDGKWATEDKRNERLQNYLKGFTIDGMWNGEQMVGAGDLFNIEDPNARFLANFINPTTLVSAYNGFKNYQPDQRGALGRYQTKPKAGKPQQVVEYDLTGQPARVVNGKAPNGQVVVSEAKFIPNENLQTRYYTTKPETAPLSAKTGQVGARYRNTGSNNAENIKRLDQAGRFMSHQNWVVEGTPFQMMPFNAAFRYDPKVTHKYNDGTPTANFWYSGEGNPNTYAQGRIATGEVVPGTSGRDGKGGQSGGNVVVNNTKGDWAPSFGGITVGTGRDNHSSMYMPLGYKQGGRLKLIPKKQ